jgi:hypothetical protein
MIKYTCPQCNRTIQLANIRKIVFCSCGGIAHNPEWAGKPVALYGPGDAMKEITQELGIHEKQECSCRSLRQKMNVWGVEGCRVPENHAWIVAQMQANATKYSWLETLQFAMAAVVSPLAFVIDPMDIYGSLVNEAIRRAEAASVSNPETP